MTETTWPFPDRPGIPLNPDRDGWHWLEGATETPAALEWRASVLKPDIRGWYLHRAQYGVMSAQEMARWTYLGPCLTPEEAAALQARADRNAAEYARVDDKARLAEFLHKQEIAAKEARVAELEAALDQLLDDMRDGLCVCQQAKDEARAALGGKDE